MILFGTSGVKSPDVPNIIMRDWNRIIVFLFAGALQILAYP